MTVSQLQPEHVHPTMSHIHPVKSKQQEADELTSRPLNTDSSPNDQSLTEDDPASAVASVIDDLVNNVAMSLSVEDEKTRVQKLINDLVSRVREDAIDAAPSTQSSATPSAQSKPSRKSPGVPYGDHRLRRVQGKPVMWMQTMDSLTLSIQIPTWVRKQHVAIVLKPGSVKARVAREDEVVVDIDEPLVAQIDVDGCTWAVVDTGGRRQLALELEKAKEQWWAKLFMADDPSQYVLVEEGDSTQETTVSDLPCDAEGNEIEEVVEMDITGGGVAQRAAGTEALGKTQESGESMKANAVQMSTTGLEQVVSETVDEVVDAVAEEREFIASNSTGRGVDSKPVEKTGAAPRQKALTRADLTAMIEQYKEAFKKGGQGASSAAMQLATFYHHGIGVDRNDAQAARLYKYALEHGRLDPAAAFQLGLIYNQGAPGLEPNAEEAVRWWKVSAELGNPVAMFNLGVMAVNGSGCDMDPLLATQWFQQAQALNPQLRPPQFTKAQLEERMAIAAKLKKQRMKEMMPLEERQRRREEALRKARYVGYTSLGIVSLTISIMAIRHWMRNRL